MARHGNSARRGARFAAVRNVLVEGGGAHDGGLVDLLVRVDVVDGTVAGHTAHPGSQHRAHAVAVVLSDVVLDQRVGGPAVDGGEDRAGCSRGAALVVNGSVACESATVPTYNVQRWTLKCGLERRR